MVWGGRMAWGGRMCGVVGWCGVGVVVSCGVVGWHGVGVVGWCGIVGGEEPGQSRNFLTSLLSTDGTFWLSLKCKCYNIMRTFKGLAYLGHCILLLYYYYWSGIIKSSSVPHEYFIDILPIECRRLVCAYSVSGDGPTHHPPSTPPTT